MNVRKKVAHAAVATTWFRKSSSAEDAMDRKPWKLHVHIFNEGKELQREP
jgi:hypothetical protein